jgi:succinyl-CoA synthetase alpha subunit
MAILVDENSIVIVQGITGREGTFCAGNMAAGGTKVVGGTSPGKGGQTVRLTSRSGFDGGDVPVFDSVAEAVEATGANVSAIFVPPGFAQDAIIEAADAGIGVIVCMTEGIPVRQTVEAVAHLERLGIPLVGPNCPGLASPPSANVGMMPNDIFTLGPVGLVSRSGTLTMEIVYELSEAGIGQSTCVGIGGDPVHGVGFVDCLRLFEADPATRAVVLVGEIGGDEEEDAARFVTEAMSKPVMAYIAGFTAPPGKKMGHAGAIVSGSASTATAKAESLEAVGIAVAREPGEVVELLGATGLKDHHS